MGRGRRSSGQQQLGVDVGDAAQERVGGQAPDDAQRPLDEARAAVGERVQGVALRGDDGLELALHQHRHDLLEVGERAVERHPAEAGATRDVGHRGAAQADGHDALVGGVEDAIVVQVDGWCHTV